MATAPATPPHDRRADERLDATGVVLALIAAVQILPGLVAVLAPGVFYDRIGPYPPENSHFIRDLGSWQIALGLLALLALRDRSLRVPALAVLTVQLVAVVALAAVLVRERRR